MSVVLRKKLIGIRQFLTVRIVDGERKLYEAEEGGRIQTIKGFVYRNEEFNYHAERERHALEILVKKMDLIRHFL